MDKPDQIALLLVHADPAVWQRLMQQVAGQPFRCLCASSFAAAQAIMQRHTPRLIVAGGIFADGDALQLLRETAAKHPDVVCFLCADRENHSHPGSDDRCALGIHQIFPEQDKLHRSLSCRFDAMSDAAEACEYTLYSTGWSLRASGLVRLLAMEYGANVIQHGIFPADAQCQISLRVQDDHGYLFFRDNSLPWDFSASLAHATLSGADRDCGRGLAIIRSLVVKADFWRIEPFNFVCFLVSRRHLDTGCPYQ